MRQPLAIVMLANEVTHKRCREAMDKLRNYEYAL